MQILWRLARRSALGALLAMAALCFGPRAASGQAAPAKSSVVDENKAASNTNKARLRNVAYKTPAHKRRRRRRHRVILPKQPSADRTEEIQSALERGGYYRGDATGKWDASTQESLRRFQQANGLPPTGKLDALSLQKMGLGSDVAGVSAPRPVTGNNSSSSSGSATPKTPGG